MKMTKNILLATVLTLAVALPAASQVRFGIRGGITVGEMRFDREIIDSDNRVGYTAGVLLDFNIPVVGLGAEVSAMYTHRDNLLSDQKHIYKRNYIDIPVYARYRLDITGVGQVFAPYIFTGPCFSILFNENAPSNYENSKTCLSWDVGGGMDLFKRVRLSVTYGMGITKAMNYIDREYTGTVVDGKDRFWTLGAAVFF